MGIAKLGIAPCGRVLADRFSDRPYSCLGLRRHAAGNSRNAGAPNAPSSQYLSCSSQLALSSLSVAGFFLLPRASARKVDKSIAVLPFENLSDEKDNAYFADGMQDDILTNLSKIGDLKVISRMSVILIGAMRGATRAKLAKRSA